MSQVQSQQASQAATSGQISSMNQHAQAAGGDDYPALDAMFFGGLGKANSLGLDNVGLGKMFTSGPLEAGLNAPGGKTLGKLLEGLEMSFDAGGGQEGEGAAGQQAEGASQPADHDQQVAHDQQHQASGEHGPADQMGGQPPVQNSNELPHGYGPDNGAQQQAMGMGGDPQQGRGNQETPFGYGEGAPDSGMFGSFKDDRGPYSMDIFAGSGAANAGSFADQQSRYAYAGYSGDSGATGSGSSGGGGASGGSSGGGDSSDGNNQQGIDDGRNDGPFPEAMGSPGSVGGVENAEGDVRSQSTPGQGEEKATKRGGGSKGR